MIWVALKLLLLFVSVVPVLTGAAALWRRAWVRASLSEVLLAGAIATCSVLLAEVVLIGSIPAWLAPRPLDWLAPVHAVVWLAGAAISFRSRRMLIRLGSRFHQAWRAAARDVPLVRMLVLGVLAWHLLVMVYGAWNWSSVGDDLTYHLPQAIQPVQDGRLGPVRSEVVWADSYPRTAALIWSWSILLVRTDAGIHPINGCFGLLLALATIVGARRLGVSRTGALFAGALVPSAPIVSYLTSITYSDLVQGGLVAAAVAMALPERRSGDQATGSWSVQSCVVCAASIALALTCKFVVAPVAGAIVLYRLVLCAAAARSSGHAAGRKLAWMLLIGVAGLALASAPYLRAWATYGSPVYPLQLRLGGWVLFPGPMDPDSIGASDQMAWLPRFVRAWSDWLVELGPESPGSFGPLMTLLMLVPASASLCGAFLPSRPGRADRAGPALMLLLLVVVLVVPLYNWPRYSVWALMPLAALTGGFFDALAGARLRAPLCAVALALTCGNAAIFGRSALEHLSQTVAQASELGVGLAGEFRNRPVVEHVYRPSALEPTGATRASFRALLKPGQTGVSAVEGAPVLLCDPGYTFKVEYRVAAPGPALGRLGPRPADPASADVERWAAWLASTGARVVMVYQGSPEHRAIEALGHAWELRTTQPPTQGRSILLYARAESPGER